MTEKLEMRKFPSPFEPLIGPITFRRLAIAHLEDGSCRTMRNLLARNLQKTSSLGTSCGLWRFLSFLYPLGRFFIWTSKSRYTLERNDARKPAGVDRCATG
jgi:hypothetical protein